MSSGRGGGQGRGVGGGGGGGTAGIGAGTDPGRVWLAGGDTETLPIIREIIGADRRIHPWRRTMNVGGVYKGEG